MQALSHGSVLPHVILSCLLISWTEQENKATMVHYGRASTIWPRTLEILDQLDLAEGLLQIGFATRDALHFRDGHRIVGGFLFATRMDKLGVFPTVTFLQIRQRRTEEHFTAALKDQGTHQHIRTRLESFTLEESAENGYPVTVQARNLDNNELFEIKTKYLIGADGAHSTVRSLAGIAFNGERTTTRWIRIDGVVKTTMPNPRCLCSIDSKSHGQILWVPLDNGVTRIGYVFSQELLEKYGGLEGVTEKVVEEEAILALQPFKLEFLAIHWFTTYGVKQAIAEKFFVQDRIFLAGDACHTHSSGAAQGLNTGIHECLNLRGLGRKSLLESYNEERKPSAQKASSYFNLNRVIDNDKTISMLISGKYPPRFQGRTEHPRYDFIVLPMSENILLCTRDILTENFLNAEGTSTIMPGERGPDVYLTCVGIATPIRLHQVLKNEGKFNIVVFAGNPLLSHAALEGLNSALAAPTSFTRTFPAERVFRFTTLTAAAGDGVTDVLGVPPFGGGCLYFDAESRAHAMYGVEVNRGAIVVFRPDGWVGCVVPLEKVDQLGNYFGHFLVPVSGTPSRP
ncbi:FAD binding domain-containing protein [Mycena albidolilacea]|uniref:FAD binding domain-containing protein n=1 Tax=Mycena albidolilacea TaxID=1033008 RepID=A0AAD7ADQ9_9AGAR|nr:FAD binding domain-containing protein [Mycena albidolilacea]